MTETLNFYKYETEYFKQFLREYTDKMTNEPAGLHEPLIGYGEYDD
jgi:hypothetical protein